MEYRAALITAAVTGQIGELNGRMNFTMGLKRFAILSARTVSRATGLKTVTASTPSNPNERESSTTGPTKVRSSAKAKRSRKLS